MLHVKSCFQNLNGFFHKPSSIIQQEALFKSCFEQDASVPQQLTVLLVKLSMRQEIFLERLLFQLLDYL